MDNNKVFIPNCTFSFMTHAAFIAFKTGLQRRHEDKAVFPFVREVVDPAVLKELQEISNHLIHRIKFPIDSPVSHVVTFDVASECSNNIYSRLEHTRLSISASITTKSESELFDVCLHQGRHYIARIEKMKVEKDPLDNDSYVPAGIRLFEVVCDVSEEPFQATFATPEYLIDRLRDNVFYMYITTADRNDVISTYKQLFLSPLWNECPIKFCFKCFKTEEDLEGVFTPASHGVVITLPLRDEKDCVLNDMYWVPNTMRVFEALYNYNRVRHDAGTTAAAEEMSFHVYVPSKKMPIFYGYSLECVTGIMKSFRIAEESCTLVEELYGYEQMDKSYDVVLLPLSLTAEPFQKAIQKLYSTSK